MHKHTENQVAVDVAAAVIAVSAIANETHMANILLLLLFFLMCFNKYNIKQTTSLKTQVARDDLMPFENCYTYQNIQINNENC